MGDSRSSEPSVNQGEPLENEEINSDESSGWVIMEVSTGLSSVSSNLLSDARTGMEPEDRAFEQLMAKLKKLGRRINPDKDQKAEIYVGFLQKVRELYRTFDHEGSLLTEGAWIHAINISLPRTPAWRYKLACLGEGYLTPGVEAFVDDLERFARESFP